MNASDICKTASDLVGGDRQVTHGDKTINFQNIADLWNAIIKIRARQAGGHFELTLDALDVANMLEAFKLARRYSGSHNLDDYIDGAGYAGCAGEIAENMAGVQKGAGSSTPAQPNRESLRSDSPTLPTEELLRMQPT